jgi:hypothetical protein
MSSSFQDKTIETEYEDVFANVMALYNVLKSENRPQSLRRAELKQGSVTAEPIDFIADVEIKSKRILNPTQYRLVLKYAVEDRYESVPKVLQQALGKLFLNSGMNYDGDYRVLYFRAKNNQLNDRDEPTHFPEGE